MAQIYLISPPKIDLAIFCKDLESALATNLVSVFQLRLKNYTPAQVLAIAHQVKKICDNHQVPLIINDYFDIAIEVNAAGVHVGIDDQQIATMRKKSAKNFIIGASCYNSKHLAMQAGEQGADYISFGAFYPTTTKIPKAQATLDTLSWASEMLNLPIVAIGGINQNNCRQLVDNGADFIAVIAAVWQYQDGVVAALKALATNIKI